MAATTLTSSLLVAALALAEMADAQVESTSDVTLGRYQTMLLQPRPEQRDLLAAVIDMEFGQEVETVRDAIVVVLSGSGYTLVAAACQEELFGLPLPSVHRKLGPLSLRQTLDVLSGPGWRPVIDQNRRSLSFERVRREASAVRDDCHCA